jgi:spoIIIJ-associated protein
MTITHQFTGKSLDDALNQAAKFFAVDKAFVCYNVISNSQKTGFLAKIFSTKIQIEAWVETAKEDLQEAARKAVQEVLKPKPTKPIQREKSVASKSAKPTKVAKEIKETPNLNKSTSDFSNEKVKELLEKYNQYFFTAFSLSKDQYNIEQNNGNIVVNVEDEYLEDMLTKSDKISLAYEHVFKRLAQKNIGDLSGRLSLNAGTSAEKRNDRLVNIAKSLADKVRKTGRNVVISSKSSQERRIIHLALDGIEGIATRSIGIGEKRRLVIYSTSKQESKPSKPNNTKGRHSSKQNKNANQKKKNNQSAMMNEKIINE